MARSGSISAFLFLLSTIAPLRRNGCITPLPEFRERPTVNRTSRPQRRKPLTASPICRGSGLPEMATGNFFRTSAPAELKSPCCRGPGAL